MILLAVNCGFGNSDCGKLPLRALDLDSGWLNFERPTTGVSRRCPIWPETAAAISKVLERRPQPKTEDAEDCVFVTKYGGSWSGNPKHNPVTKEFHKLLKDKGLDRKGLGFYALRHTFRTVADEARDQPAAISIMGHIDDSMAETYRERISDDRLRAVTDYVRAWVFPGTTGKSQQKNLVRPPQEKTPES